MALDACAFLCGVSRPGVAISRNCRSASQCFLVSELCGEVHGSGIVWGSSPIIYTLPVRLHPPEGAIHTVRDAAADVL